VVIEQEDADRVEGALVLGDGDRERLERLTRSSTVSAGAAQRADRIAGRGWGRRSASPIGRRCCWPRSWAQPTTPFVEVWFCLTERRTLRRGIFTEVKDLNAKIRAYIDGWNDRSHPFAWTRIADEILAKANRMKTSMRATRSDGGEVTQGADTGLCSRPFARLQLEGTSLSGLGT
jgi:hypothetical protein